MGSSRCSWAHNRPVGRQIDSIRPCRCYTTGGGVALEVVMMTTDLRAAAVAAADERWKMLAVRTWEGHPGHSVLSVTNSKAITRLRDTLETLAVHILEDYPPSMEGDIEAVRDELMDTIETRIKAFAAEFIVSEAERLKKVAS